MLRYIVCEDNKDFLERMCIIINKVMIPYKYNYKISKFNSYNKTLAEIINKKHAIKIYVLDIELGDISGLEIASEIREKDTDSLIVFVTSHSECRDDIFYSRLMVVDYIAKDCRWSERFHDSIEYAIKSISKGRVLSFSFDYTSYMVPFDDIIYIEKVQDLQKCIIHTENEETFEISTSMRDLLEKLGPNFFQSHKSYIINMGKVKSINYSEGMITFNDDKNMYLLSNRRKKELREYVENY